MFLTIRLNFFYEYNYKTFRLRVNKEKYVIERGNCHNKEVDTKLLVLYTMIKAITAVITIHLRLLVGNYYHYYSHD